MAVHALVHAGLAALGDQARGVKLGDEVVQVVVGQENDVAAPPSIAAARAALGDESLAVKGDAALAAVAGAGENFDLVDEHGELSSELRPSIFPGQVPKGGHLLPQPPFYAQNRPDRK